MSFAYRVYLDKDWKVEDLGDLLVRDLSLERASDSANNFYSTDAGYHLNAASPLSKTILLESFGIDATLNMDCPTWGAEGLDQVLAAINYFLSFYDFDMLFCDNAGGIYLIRRSGEIILDERKSTVIQMLEATLQDSKIALSYGKLLWK